MSKAQKQNKLSSVTVNGTPYKGHPSDLFRPQTPPMQCRELLAN